MRNVKFRKQLKFAKKNFFWRLKIKLARKIYAEQM